MKNRGKHGPVFRAFIFLTALLLLTVALAVGVFYYVFAIPEPDGLSLASWPKRFTDNFSLWMHSEGGMISVEEIGERRLDEYGLWLQVLDEDGREVYSRNKPEDCPDSYPASALLAAGMNPPEGESTIFCGRLEDAGGTWGYLIGFPYAIGKYMLYYNGEAVSRLSPVIRLGILLAMCALIGLVLGYGFWLSKKVSAITEGIRGVSRRTYEPLKETGVFGEIGGELNQLDREIRRSDSVQEETDRMRREWIANITHDLKTPLSPIRGYAELLAESDCPREEAVREYGRILLKNAGHVEKLIDDLKMTYQLESGALPFAPKPVRLVSFLRELTIDLVNNPAFAGRPLTFESEMPETFFSVDPDLFGRAVSNLIINALVHNPQGTQVTVAVEKGSRDSGCRIRIVDNGRGMSESEQEKLFCRYYRGTGTREKAEGSGLGLAIARQIVVLHGGEITVKSRVGEGTEFVVFLP